jgi:peptidyl-prolyl cis-trans isomerase B (cyclophilin B)
VASITRQRKLARAKLDRQMARRAERERRGRQFKAGIGGTLALVLVGLGVAWKLGAFDSEPASTVVGQCTWQPQETTNNPDLQAVGTPADSGIAESGTSAMTIALSSAALTPNDGTLVVELDRAKAPCAAASLTFLAGKGFYNGQKCHQLSNTEGTFALHCGDASGTGKGGAAYTWYPENVPAAAAPTTDPSADPSASPAASPTPTIRYPKGTVAMTPGINGSQFVIFYQDSVAESANYSVVGSVSAEGLALIEKIAAAGTKANGNQQGVLNAPKEDVTIQTLTVVDNAATTAPSASAQPSPSAVASATPSASAS